jgi:hypothetical protein
MMQRDMDLIRELLLRFEKGDQTVPPGRSQEVVAYHVEQMNDSGLIKALIRRKIDRGHRLPHYYFVQDITPAGHDFIAQVRNDSFWLKLKKQFEEKAAPMTVELIIVAAKKLGAQLLGM